MKRFLSIILATVMVIALLPSAFAATDAETGKTVYKYEFTLAGAGEEITENEKASDNGLKDQEKKYFSARWNLDREVTVNGMGNDANEAGADWSFVGTYGFYTNTDDMRYIPSLTEYGVFGWLQKNTHSATGANGLTLEINIPESGKYMPKINIASNGVVADYHVALVSKAVNGKKYTNAAGSLKEWNFVSDPSNSTAWAVDVLKPEFTTNGRTLPDEYTYLLKASFGEEQTKDFTKPIAFFGNAVDLQAGDYYLVISMENGSVAGLDAYINSFELEKVPVTKYEFTLGAAGETGNYVNSVTDATNLHTEKGMGNADWTYVGGLAYTAGKDNYFSQLTPYGFWYYSASSNGSLGNNGIVFEINVPDDGEYITTLNYLPSYAAGTVYACIIDKAIDGRLHTNDYPYDFCDTVSDEVSIAASASYAVTALKTSLTNGTDLRSEIKLALSGELQYTNTAKVTDATIAEIKANEAVALKAGKYYLVIASDGNTTEYSTNSKYMPYINSFEIEKVGELDDELDAAFAVTETKAEDYVAPTVKGITLNGQTIEATQNGDGSYNLTAPETNDKGKNFLYWAMGLVGNKRIVSFSETLENYVPEGNYKNYLVPVYEGDINTTEKEFYNQNGQLIPDADENTPVSMPGYGSTSTWKQYGETNIYVADYGKTATRRDKVTVTVNGGEGGGKVPFGTSVTCTANAADGNGNPFKCWKKTNLDGTSEIVSIDKAYTFKAWETCTVTAEYEKHSFVSVVKKIITDSFDVGSEKGIMAEFVGFDNKVVEKGIMFGDNKIAMTAPGSQFSVIADKNGEYKGYAIVKNTDGTYSLITGNVITVSDITESDDNTAE